MNGFMAFNREYRSVLEDWDLLIDGANPIARTNVAPVENPTSESVVVGFFLHGSERHRTTDDSRCRWRRAARHSRREEHCPRRGNE